MWQVTFRWQDRAHGNAPRLATVAAEAFLRRFLLHVLPPRFVRIRHYGWLANSARHRLLPTVREGLGPSPTRAPAPPAVAPDTWEATLLRLTGKDVTRCPSCGAGGFLIVAAIPARAEPGDVARRGRSPPACRSSRRHGRDPEAARHTPTLCPAPFEAPTGFTRPLGPGHFAPSLALSPVTGASPRLQHPASETPRASPIPIAGAGFVQRDFFTHRGIARRRPSCSAARRAKKPSSLCHVAPHPPAPPRPRQRPAPLCVGYARHVNGDACRARAASPNGGPSCRIALRSRARPSRRAGACWRQARAQ